MQELIEQLEQPSSICPESKPWGVADKDFAVGEKFSDEANDTDYRGGYLRARCWPCSAFIRAAQLPRVALRSQQVRREEYPCARRSPVEDRVRPISFVHSYMCKKTEIIFGCLRSERKLMSRYVLPSGVVSSRVSCL